MKFHEQFCVSVQADTTAALFYSDVVKENGFATLVAPTGNTNTKKCDTHPHKRKTMENRKVKKPGSEARSAPLPSQICPVALDKRLKKKKKRWHVAMAS
jgi:hypothetical protein